MPAMRIGFALALGFVLLAMSQEASSQRGTPESRLEWIEVSGMGFVRSPSGEPWFAHGYNYTTNNVGDRQRLIEEIWEDEWETVVEDLREMAEREANLVRFHMQLPIYFLDHTTMNEAALDRLERLARAADEQGIYLMLVGLAAYREASDPDWYVALDEAARWEVHERFWRAVAERMAPYSSVMSYDLVNEPVVVAGQDSTDEWWTGELDGLRFVQRINRNGDGRAAEEIAEAWTRRMIEAIRAVDERHPITIGTLAFPASAFGPEKAGRLLDFASPHVYPDSRNRPVPEAVAEAIRVTEAFAVTGQPVLIGETFPLNIGREGFELYVRGARRHVAGFVSHYFGRTEAEHDPASLVESVQASALEQWVRLGPMLRNAEPAAE